MTLEVCDQQGNCCETLIRNDATNLKEGVLSKFTGDQIKNCAGKNLDIGGNIQITVEKPGPDGWKGSYIE